MPIAKAARQLLLLQDLYTASTQGLCSWLAQCPCCSLTDAAATPQLKQQSGYHRKPAAMLIKRRACLPPARL